MDIGYKNKYKNHYFLTFAAIMKKKVSQIILPLLFIFCVAASLEASLPSFSKEQTFCGMIFSNNNHGAFPHNHIEEPEFPNENFFCYNNPSGHSGTRIYSEKINLEIFWAQMKFTNASWHPPRLI